MTDLPAPGDIMYYKEMVGIIIEVEVDEWKEFTDGLYERIEWFLIPKRTNSLNLTRSLRVDRLGRFSVSCRLETPLGGGPLCPWTMDDGSSTATEIKEALINVNAKLGTL
jgi:hypothetical protein